MPAVHDRGRHFIRRKLSKIPEAEMRNHSPLDVRVVSEMLVKSGVVFEGHFDVYDGKNWNNISDDVNTCTSDVGRK